MTSVSGRILWTVGAVLSAGVAVVSWRYLAPDPAGADFVLGNPHAHPWLFVHAGFAATALLAGPFQFLPGLRAARPRLHRWTGRLYVAACLAGGVSGLILASTAQAGPVATAGFGMLAVLWLISTAQAWRLARARRFQDHRRWMIRSFALTFAAVTLRLYLPLAGLLPVPFLDAYRAISFLCWVPNLIAAELWLHRSRIPAVAAASATIP